VHSDGNSKTEDSPFVPLDLPNLLVSNSLSESNIRNVMIDLPSFLISLQLWLDFCNIA